MKKSKKKLSKKNMIHLPSSDNQVLLGVRVTESERQKIKMYAIQHGTTVTNLVRGFIHTLSSAE